MTVAMGKQLALGLFGAAGVSAAVMSAALIWAIATAPERLAMEMGEGSIRELLTLALRWLVALVGRAFS